MRQVLLIGLDGFDPVLTRRWMDEGRLPTLKSIADKGFFSALRSTIPPFTYPAWSSMLTGVNPGRHGIIDFAIRIPGKYSVEYVNSTFRLEPTLFHRLSEAGKRIVAMGFPTTYPPEAVNGVMISGFDSPLSFQADRSFCYPSALWKELKKSASAYTLAGIQELNTSRGWHLKAKQTIMDTIETRTTIAEYLLQKEHWDLFSIVFSESDTAAHHFWAASDHLSPRHAQFDGNHGDFLRNVYSQLDNTVKRLVDRVDKDALILVVSDHGSGGAGTGLLSLNRILETAGFLQYKNTHHPSTEDSSTSAREPAAFWRIKSLARKLPAHFGQWFFRYGPRHLLQSIETHCRLANLNLQNCVAFSDELNYFPSVWIHDNRFPFGKHYDGNKRNEILETIRTCLLDYRHPETGKPVIRNAYPKNVLYNGPAIDRIPDLIIEPELEDNYSFTIWNPACHGPAIEKLPTREWLGRKGGSMNGSHRPLGVLLSNAALVTGDRLPSVEDIGVTILDHFGTMPAGWKPDGISLKTGNSLVTDPVDADAKRDNPKNFQVSFSPTQASQIQERLRGLGYL